MITFFYAIVTKISYSDREHIKRGQMMYSSKTSHNIFEWGGRQKFMPWVSKSGNFKSQYSKQSGFRPGFKHERWNHKDINNPIEKAGGTRIRKLEELIISSTRKRVSDVNTCY